MVYGYHVILPHYGFWLPNDPRGSWSDFVGSWELARFGNSTQALCVAKGFQHQAEKSDYEVWACAILPEHTHLVIARHRYKVEQIRHTTVKLGGQQDPSVLIASNLFLPIPFANHYDRRLSSTCPPTFVTATPLSRR